MSQILREMLQWWKAHEKQLVAARTSGRMMAYNFQTTCWEIDGSPVEVDSYDSFRATVSLRWPGATDTTWPAKSACTRSTPTRG